MNKSLILKLSLTLGLSVGVISSVILATTRSNSYNEAKADATYTDTNPTQINVTDSSESAIKSYYSSLANLSSTELKGNNLLKNLKTILINNHQYTSYNNVRNWFMITDRDWIQSPLSSSQLNNYQYTSTDSGSGTSKGPIVHQLYRNDNGDSTAFRYPASAVFNAVEIDREHVWPKSTGFPTNYEYRPAGTDMHHLMLGDGTVNSDSHSNYDYADGQTPGVTSSYTDFGNKDVVCKYNGTSYDTVYAYMHNGSKTWTTTSGTSVFEPQDQFKGDIARACFYMVARYNNYANASTLPDGEANLYLDENLSPTGNTDSTASSPVGLASLSTLLRWHEQDPVDDFEIHRNNLIYNNFQHNRNPFIDYPEWVNIAFGSSSTYAKVNSDSITQYGSTGLSIGCPSSVALNSSTTLTPVIASGYQSGYSSGHELFVWTSSDTSVATVSSSGVLTAKKLGNVTITCQTKNSNFYAKKTITVSNSGSSIPLQSISLSPSALSLTKGNSANLSVTYTPVDATNKNVAWSSNNESVASVSNSGVVTAVGKGSATITATAEDGGHTATCAVSVTQLEYTYDLVTTNSLNDGDEVYISAKNSSGGYYVMGTEKVTYAYYLKSTLATVSNNQLTPTDSMALWTVSKSGSNYSFSINSTYLNSYINGSYYNIVYANSYSSYTMYNSWSYSSNQLKSTGNIYLTHKFYNSTPEFGGANSAPSDYTMHFFRKTSAATYDANAFAQDFLNSITCDATGNTAPTLSRSWSDLAALFNTLSASEKSTLVNASANESGTLIERAMARYDFLCRKYNQFNNFIGRASANSSNAAFLQFYQDRSLILAFSIAFGVVALGAAVLITLKKKKVIQ